MLLIQDVDIELNRNVNNANNNVEQTTNDNNDDNKINENDQQPPQKDEDDFDGWHSLTFFSNVAIQNGVFFL